MIAVLPGVVSAWLLVSVVVRLVRPLPTTAKAEGTERTANAPERTPLADRLVHPAVVAGAVVAAPLSSGLSLLLPITGLGVRSLRVRRRRRRKAQAQRHLIDNLPETIDLLSLAVSSGLVLRDAVAEVAALGRGGALEAAMATALGPAHPEEGGFADRLEDRLVALGEPARPLAAVVAAGVRYGTPVIDPLDRLARDAGVARRRQAETEARRLPVLMLLPLVFCGLPSFILLAVMPVALSALDQLAG